MLKVFARHFVQGENTDLIEMLGRLAIVSQELGYTQTQVAIAWACANPDVSTAILGFSRLAQIDENLKAVELLEKWDSDIERKVTGTLLNNPELEMNWRTWTQD